MEEFNRRSSRRLKKGSRVFTGDGTTPECYPYISMGRDWRNSPHLQLEVATIALTMVWLVDDLRPCELAEKTGLSQKEARGLIDGSFPRVLKEGVKVAGGGCFWRGISVIAEKKVVMKDDCDRELRREQKATAQHLRNEKQKTEDLRRECHLHMDRISLLQELVESKKGQIAELLITNHELIATKDDRLPEMTHEVNLFHDHLIGVDFSFKSRGEGFLEHVLGPDTDFAFIKGHMPKCWQYFAQLQNSERRRATLECISDLNKRHNPARAEKRMEVDNIRIRFLIEMFYKNFKGSHRRPSYMSLLMSLQDKLCGHPLVVRRAISNVSLSIGSDWCNKIYGYMCQEANDKLAVMIANWEHAEMVRLYGGEDTLRVVVAQSDNGSVRKGQRMGGMTNSTGIVQWIAFFNFIGTNVRIGSPNIIPRCALNLNNLLDMVSQAAQEEVDNVIYDNQDNFESEPSSSDSDDGVDVVLVAGVDGQFFRLSIEEEEELAHFFGLAVSDNVGVPYNVHDGPRRKKDCHVVITFFGTIKHLVKDCDDVFNAVIHFPSQQLFKESTVVVRIVEHLQVSIDGDVVNVTNVDDGECGRGELVVGIGALTDCGAKRILNIDMSKTVRHLKASANKLRFVELEFMMRVETVGSDARKRKSLIRFLRDRMRLSCDLDPHSFSIQQLKAHLCTFDGELPVLQSALNFEANGKRRRGIMNLLDKEIARREGVGEIFGTAGERTGLPPLHPIPLDVFRKAMQRLPSDMRCNPRLMGQNAFTSFIPNYSSAARITALDLDTKIMINITLLCRCVVMRTQDNEMASVSFLTTQLGHRHNIMNFPDLFHILRHLFALTFNAHPIYLLLMVNVDIAGFGKKFARQTLKQRDQLAAKWDGLPWRATVVMKKVKQHMAETGEEFTLELVAKCARQTKKGEYSTSAIGSKALKKFPKNAFVVQVLAREVNEIKSRILKVFQEFLLGQGYAHASGMEFDDAFDLVVEEYPQGANAVKHVIDFLTHICPWLADFERNSRSGRAGKCWGELPTAIALIAKGVARLPSSYSRIVRSALNQLHDLVNWQTSAPGLLEVASALSKTLHDEVHERAVRLVMSTLGSHLPHNTLDRVWEENAVMAPFKVQMRKRFLEALCTKAPARKEERTGTYDYENPANREKVAAILNAVENSVRDIFPGEDGLAPDYVVSISKVLGREGTLGNDSLLLEMALYQQYLKGSFKDTRESVAQANRVIAGSEDCVVGCDDDDDYFYSNVDDEIEGSYSSGDSEMEYLEDDM